MALSLKDKILSLPYAGSRKFYRHNQLTLEFSCSRNRIEIWDNDKIVKTLVISKGWQNKQVDDLIDFIIKYKPELPKPELKEKESFKCPLWLMAGLNVLVFIVSIFLLVLSFK